MESIPLCCDINIGIYIDVEHNKLLIPSINATCFIPKYSILAPKLHDSKYK